MARISIEQINRLNMLGSELFNLNEQGNIAKRHSIINEIYRILAPVFSPKKYAADVGLVYLAPYIEDALQVFFEKWLKKFDPEKGEFWGFCNFRIENLAKDLYRKATSHDNVSFEQHHHENPSAPEFMASSNDTMEDNDRVNYILLRVAPVMINLKEHLKGRANNESRMMYLRLFFTDTIANFVRANITPPNINNERDVINAMNLVLLDYVMFRQCRNIRQIHSTRTKRICDIIDGGRDNRITFPLQYDIINAFFAYTGRATVTSAALSQQRRSYVEFFGQFLGE